MLNKKIEYTDGETTFEGYLVSKDESSTKKPAVIVVHDWSGNNQFAHHKAERLAELGYIAFACDMYGHGQTGKTKEEKTVLIQPLMKDRKLLQKRMQAALTAVKKLDGVDPARVGAIGFCFGGLCVLDLARSGAELKGVVSFHGLLNAPEHGLASEIKSQILVLHGYDDPMVKPEQLHTFTEEMTKAKAKWEVNIYSNTMHGFTNPEANDPNFGTVYSKEADTRSWIAMQNFFKEVL